ncbi:uncharacterized protein Eint_060080 [Encephalitozoon intestinalis ATCC 50506]|uniref:Uncharacterized protein n=1 Tax=Encephalitozoon intestinalis (strain ATCC 50506) TaxID=876142 RepID=E0S7D8_ENCIT|nr:uncharacterized protein Eint_060080 [Encephalitozoon intestinalis ATCC 50506]ADM11617.1 hypothetical protein Eint_060080 [Encephalitozoon intestinalis ATCC 50506]UTX45347.1 RidL-like interaptin [Encephalitozoon intestinalis]
MLASSLLRNVLTADEQQLMPESLLKKLGEEMALYEEMAKGKVRELEKKAELCEEIISDLNKKMVKQEVETKEMKNSCLVMERSNEMYLQEIRSLRGEVAYYKEKAFLDGGRAKSFEEARTRLREMDLLAKEKKDLENREEILKKKCMELENSNRRLTEKVLEQKNQTSYLLKKVSGSDNGRDSLELVRLVQKLSKKNEELERTLGSGGNSTSLLQSSGGESVEAEREEYRKIREELYEVKKNGCILELEYNKVFREKNELYNQMVGMNEEKKAMQKRIDEMKEEIVCLKIDLKNTKMKNTILGDASQKLNEMNNEIVQNNFIIKDSRNKIRELKTQLAESEERYNRYILEDRTNIVAIIGREIEGIKKKLETDFKHIYDIEEDWKRAVEEQKRLKDLFFRYEEEVSGLARKNEILINNENSMVQRIRHHEEREGMYRNALFLLGRDVRCVYEFMGEIGRELGGLMDTAEKIEKSEKEGRMLVEKIYGELEQVERALEERNGVLRSLMENHNEETIVFLEKERNILKQENIFLRNKMENLGDSSDLLEKISSLEEENKSIKGQLGLLEKTYASEKEIMSRQSTALGETDYRCHLLQLDIDKALQENLLLKEELQKAEKEIANNYAAIDKYRVVIEKLKKIKDAYLKLRNECLAKESQQKNIKEEDDGTKRQEQSFDESPKVPGGLEASQTVADTMVEKKEDENTKALAAKEDSEIRLENKSPQNLASNEVDGNRSQQGRNKRTGRSGEEPRQGYQQKRAYSDRKRSWLPYESKRSKDRRN